MTETPKPRRSINERKSVRALMVSMDVNYTTALREYLRLEEEIRKEEIRAEEKHIMDSSQE